MSVTSGGIGGQAAGSGVPGVAAVRDGGIAVEGVAVGHEEAMELLRRVNTAASAERQAEEALDRARADLAAKLAAARPHHSLRVLATAAGKSFAGVRKIVAMYEEEESADGQA